MPIGNPVTLTSNVASKTISATATASQTLFNVTGGYRINELGVFKNGLRLQDGVDYTARDGLTVTLLSAASGGDKLQFVVFDTFRVAEAIRPAVDEQTIRGNLNVVGILSCTNLEGPVSLNITSGIQTFNDVRVGGALTVAGTLTYEDTTNTNTTGIATFSGGMNISGVGATVTTLNVTGFSTFSDNVSIGDSIFHTGDTDTAIRFSGADTFSVETGGSERFKVTDSLKEVKNGNLRITSTFIEFSGDVSTPSAAAALYRPADNEFAISTGNNERLRIDSSGRVGIGTDNPASYKLEVWAETAAALMIRSGSTSRIILSNDFTTNTLYSQTAAGSDRDFIIKTGANERLRIDSVGNAGLGGAAAVPTSTAYNTAVFHLQQTGASKGAQLRMTTESGSGHTASDGFVLSYWHDNNVYFDNKETGQIRFRTNGGDRLYILSGGQVNIGGNYTQTTYTMQVTGTFNATGNITQNGGALATNGKAIAMALIFG